MSRPRRPLRFSLLLAALVFPGCAFFPRTPVPMKTLDLPLGGKESRCLVVLLPGRYDNPRHFVRADFRGAAERAGVAADFVAVDANLGYFRNRTVLDRLREDVIAPAREKGYDTIWLVGISLEMHGCRKVGESGTSWTLLLSFGDLPAR